VSLSLFLLVTPSSTGGFGVVVLLIELIKDLVLVGLVVNILGLRARKNLPELLNLLGLE